MSWLQRANDWLRRPFGSDGGGGDDDDGSSTGRRGASMPGPGRRGALGPADTEVTVRHIFSLTNPGLVKPLGDGLVPHPDDSLTVDVADKIVRYFGEHRPEPKSFPALATRIIDLAEQPEADLAELSRLIEQDPAIAIKVLQVANSALYHREFEVGTVRAAIGHLGMFAVANVAVGVACRSLYDGESRAEYALFPDMWKELFLQSMTVAYAASQFAQEKDIGRPDQIFLAGMFHDIGKTLGLRSLAALILAEQAPRIDEHHVKKVLERAHLAVGVEAHMGWQLPQFLSTICRRHHDDEVAAGPDYTELHIIRVVSGLNTLRLSASFDRDLSRQIRQSVHALGIGQQQLRALTSSIRQAQERVTELFSVTG